MKIETTTNRIRKAAEKAGYDVSEGHGWNRTTVYLECERDNETVIVRIGDHGEAHAPKRGIRQLSISPDEMTAARAIELLVAGPTAIEKSEGKTPLDEHQKEYISARAAFLAEHKRRWQALRATLTDEDFAEFKRLGSNRTAARAIAKARGWKVPTTYAAITNGKPFSGQFRK